MCCPRFEKRLVGFHRNQRADRPARTRHVPFEPPPLREGDTYSQSADTRCGPAGADPRSIRASSMHAPTARTAAGGYQRVSSWTPTRRASQSSRCRSCVTNGPQNSRWKRCRRCQRTNLIGKEGGGLRTGPGVFSCGGRLRYAATGARKSPKRLCAWPSTGLVPERHSARCWLPVRRSSSRWADARVQINAARYLTWGRGLGRRPWHRWRAPKASIAKLYATESWLQCRGRDDADSRWHGHDLGPTPGTLVCADLRVSRALSRDPVRFSASSSHVACWARAHSGAPNAAGLRERYSTEVPQHGRDVGRSSWTLQAGDLHGCTAVDGLPADGPAPGRGPR